MALVERQITGAIKQADGEPIPFARIFFRPVGPAGSDAELIVPKLIYVDADENGELDGVLMTSDVEDSFVRYECTLPGSAPFKFDLTDGDPISIEELFNLANASSSSSAMASFEEAIAEAVADVSKGYLGYAVSLSQLGSNAPTATEWRNELGADVVWTRSNTGEYVGTLSAQPEGIAGWPRLGGFCLAGVYPDHVWLFVYDNDLQQFVLRTYDGGVLADGLLVSTFIEIRAYLNDFDTDPD